MLELVVLRWMVWYCWLVLTDVAKPLKSLSCKVSEERKENRSRYISKWMSAESLPRWFFLYKASIALCWFTKHFVSVLNISCTWWAVIWYFWVFEQQTPTTRVTVLDCSKMLANNKLLISAKMAFEPTNLDNNLRNCTQLVARLYSQSWQFTTDKWLIRARIFVKLRFVKV